MMMNLTTFFFLLLLYRSLCLRVNLAPLGPRCTPLIFTTTLARFGQSVRDVWRWLFAWVICLFGVVAFFFCSQLFLLIIVFLSVHGSLLEFLSPR